MPQQPAFPRANFSGFVPGKPLHLRFELQNGQTGDTCPTEIWRDNSGTSRLDLSDGRFSWVIEIPVQRLVVFDHVAKVAVSAQSTLTPAIGVWGFQGFPMPGETQETTMFLGARCKCIRLYEDQACSTSAGEVWIAEDLGFALKDRKPDGDREAVWQAISIDYQEPPGSVFKAPRDYQLVEQAGPR